MARQQLYKAALGADMAKLVKSKKKKGLPGLVEGGAYALGKKVGVYANKKLNPPKKSLSNVGNAFVAGVKTKVKRKKEYNSKG